MQPNLVLRLHKISFILIIIQAWRQNANELRCKSSNNYCNIQTFCNFFSFFFIFLSNYNIGNIIKKLLQKNKTQKRRKNAEKHGISRIFPNITTPKAKPPPMNGGGKRPHEKNY